MEETTEKDCRLRYVHDYALRDCARHYQSARVRHVNSSKKVWSYFFYFLLLYLDVSFFEFQVSGLKFHVFNA